MKKRILAAGFAVCMAVAFFVAFFTFPVQAAGKLPVLDFVPFSDILLAPEEYPEYQTSVQAEDRLLQDYSYVDINDYSASLMIEAWEIEPSSISDFEGKKAGEYVFYARLEPSVQYETQEMTIPPPSIRIQIAKTEEPVTVLNRFDPLEALEVCPDKDEGFDTLEQAQAALLARYSSVYADGGVQEVKISGWNLSEGAVYNAEQDGEFLFIGQLAEPERYDTSLCPEPPTLRLKIQQDLKLQIYFFNTIQPIYSTAVNPYGYRTEQEALNTLNSVLISAKVNGLAEGVGIYAWRRADEKTYNPYTAGEYTFVAETMFSEKYNVEDLVCDPPTVKVIFTLPKSYVSVWVTDENGSAMRSAEVSLENALNSYAGTTQRSGNCILYDVRPGTYTALLKIQGMEFTRPLSVREGYSSVLDWQVSLKEERAVVSPVQTRIEVTSPPADRTLELAEALLKSMTSSSGTVELYDDISGGKGLRIESVPLQEDQKEALLNMGAESLAGEVRRIVDSVTAVTVNGTSENVRRKVEGAVGNPAALILPVHFPDHAQFAFPVKVTVQGVSDLSLPVGEGYLYYYNASTGQPEYAGTAWTDGAGTLIFTISHCSDYFISSETLVFITETVSPDKVPVITSLLPVSASIEEPGGGKGTASSAPVPEVHPTVITLETAAGFSFSEVVLAAAFAAVAVMGLAVFVRNRLK